MCFGWGTAFWKNTFCVFIRKTTVGQLQKGTFFQYDVTLGFYDLVVNPQMFICMNLRLISIVTAELGDVFECEDLFMLLDSAEGMSTTLDVNAA
jgi:hypothetical protein